MKLSGGQNIHSDKGLIFDIQDFSTQDGPGIRTTIFFKGCPLKCKWCSNPEGQELFPQVMHFRSICKKSYRCVTSCPVQAISAQEGYPLMNREICYKCNTFDCTTTCYSDALKISGHYSSVSEILKILENNNRFYKNSGGGVTLSGGEPLLQPLFAKEILNVCKQLKISAGIETCGYFNWSSVNTFIHDFDFIYFDIKVIDENTHREVTGKSNKIILRNLEKLVQLIPEKITITITVIPRINNDQKTIRDILNFSRSAGINNIRLLPYHSFGMDKYSALGRNYEMDNTTEPDDADMQFIKNLAASEGMKIVN